MYSPKKRHVFLGKMVIRLLIWGSLLFLRENLPFCGLDQLDWLDWLDGPMSQQSGSSLIYLQKKTRSFPLMGLWWESIRGIRECPSMVILWWYFIGILWLLGGDWNHHGILMNFMWLSRNSWEESSFQLTVQRGRYTTNQIVFWYELFH